MNIELVDDSTCEWEEEDWVAQCGNPWVTQCGNSWITQCGNSYVLEFGDSPFSSGMVHCCYCGKIIFEVSRIK